MREAEPPPLVLMGDILEYEVERILQHYVIGARHQYLVLQKGYPLTEATKVLWGHQWQPRNVLLDGPKRIISTIKLQLQNVETGICTQSLHWVRLQLRTSINESQNVVYNVYKQKQI